MDNHFLKFEDSQILNKQKIASSISSEIKTNLTLAFNKKKKKTKNLRRALAIFDEKIILYLIQYLTLEQISEKLLSFGFHMHEFNVYRNTKEKDPEVILCDLLLLLASFNT